MNELTVSGKVKFFAPECFSGVYLATSDVFSSGMVFYRMLTGVLPWSYDIDVFDSQDEVSKKIFISRKKKPVYPSTFNEDIDDELNRIVLNSLSLSTGDTSHQLS